MAASCNPVSNEIVGGNESASMLLCAAFEFLARSRSWKIQASNCIHLQLMLCDVLTIQGGTCMWVPLGGLVKVDDAIRKRGASKVFLLQRSDGPPIYPRRSRTMGISTPHQGGYCSSECSPTSVRRLHRRGTFQRIAIEFRHIAQQRNIMMAMRKSHTDELRGTSLIMC